MRAVLKLELIGWNYHEAKHQGDTMGPRLKRYEKIMGFNQSSSWVARIYGLDDKWGFKRKFVKAQVDFSEANSQGSRGIFAYYALESGIYEVNDRYRWRKVRRYFCKVIGKDIIEISKDEVLCLLNPISA